MPNIQTEEIWKNYVLASNKVIENSMNVATFIKVIKVL